MKQISYITLFIFMYITAASQSDSEIIQNKLVTMGLDSSKLNSVQFSKHLLNTWSKSNYEENKYNPYIILPIKIWEQLFEIQNNKISKLQNLVLVNKIKIDSDLVLRSLL